MLSKRQIFEAAAKYPTRTHFAINDSTAYTQAGSMGIRDIVCSHMRYKKQPYGYWNLKTVMQDAVKCSSLQELRRTFPHAHSAAHRHDLMGALALYYGEAYYGSARTRDSVTAKKLHNIAESLKVMPVTETFAQQSAMTKAVRDAVTSTSINSLNTLREELDEHAGLGGVPEMIRTDLTAMLDKIEGMTA